MDFISIKDTVVNETIDYLQRNYTDKIETIPYIKEYVTDLIEKEFVNIDPDAKIKKINLNIYRAKKRWLDKVLLEYAKYTESRLPAKKLKLYAALIERYHNKLIEEVEKWQKDSKQYLLSFPCFETLTSSQQNLAIEKDTIMIAGTFIKQEEQKETKVYESVNSMIDLAIFSGSKRNEIIVNKESDKLDDDGNRLFKVDRLPGINKDIFDMNMYVDERFLKDLNAMVPDLNTYDYELFNDVIQFRDYRFGTTRTIEVPIRTLVEITFKGVKHFSKKHYELVKKRLLKLGFYRVSTTNENGDISLYGAFSDVNILNRDGEEFAKCTVSDAVFNAFLNHEITSIYSDELPKLKGSIAYKLVFYLQKERLVAYQAGVPNPVKFEYHRFFETIRLVKRTKREKFAAISKALQEIKEAGIILKDYYTSGDFFYLTFVELSNQELQGHNIQIDSKSLTIKSK